VSSAPDTIAARGGIPTIGVDAMGGDFGSSVVVSGVVMALREFPGRFRIVLLGDLDEMRAEVSRHRAADLPIELVHAPERVEMDDQPSTVLRRKPNSSLAIATQMQKERKLDAFFSAGSTGAVVAVSLLGLGRLEGVSRPAIASIFPNRGKGCVVLDVGATSDCKAMHLVQFAEMGSCYAHDVLGLPSPRVGLLSIGEESTKGDELRQETHGLLAQVSNLNFLGNVEGRDILKGEVDVVVTDGFTGNVVLKLAESVVGHIAQSFRREIGGSLRAKLGALLLQPAFAHMKKQFDYAEYGGAPLLGVDGVIFIGHGRSSPRAIRSAIRSTCVFVEQRVNEHIPQLLRNVHAEA
jgi:glycerol-3-phosphate acyltransferase PlsX